MTFLAEAIPYLTVLFMAVVAVAFVWANERD